MKNMTLFLLIAQLLTIAQLHASESSGPSKDSLKSQTLMLNHIEVTIYYPIWLEVRAKDGMYFTATTERMDKLLEHRNNRDEIKESINIALAAARESNLLEENTKSIWTVTAQKATLKESAKNVDCSYHPIFLH